MPTAHVVVLEYAVDPGDADRSIRRVEDLFDDVSGLPR
jgi:hypothetical protein